MGEVSLRGAGPRIVSPDEPRTEGWIIVASKDGWLRSLTPEVFTFCATREEALDRARIHCGRDPDFARRFAGCWLYAVRMDDAVSVDANRARPRQWR